jgi:hypothetical protein
MNTYVGSDLGAFWEDGSLGKCFRRSMSRPRNHGLDESLRRYGRI